MNRAAGTGRGRSPISLARSLDGREDARPQNSIQPEVAPMPEDQPVLNALAEITAVSLVRGTLPAREHVLARLAALVAVDAPTASYVMNVDSATATGVTIEDVQGLLVAVAPIVGTAKVVSASAKITEALGFVIELAVAEFEAELAAELAEAGISVDDLAGEAEQTD
jgi:alkylhydroperoxidase/carboxymuconolactone decarboxylase family protein YurZ